MLVHDRDAVALGIERCAELGRLAVEQTSPASGR